MDFSYLLTCSDDVSLLELARAAAAVGRANEADVLLSRARRAGSSEAGAAQA